jgi:hypothetical protein
MCKTAGVCGHLRACEGKPRINLTTRAIGDLELPVGGPHQMKQESQPRPDDLLP